MQAKAWDKISLQLLPGRIFPRARSNWSWLWKILMCPCADHSSIWSRQLLHHSFRVFQKVPFLTAQRLWAFGSDEAPSIVLATLVPEHCLDTGHTPTCFNCLLSIAAWIFRRRPHAHNSCHPFMSHSCVRFTS